MQLGVLLSVVLLQLGVHSSNILIWNPTIGHSHVTFLGNIADVLTADGHNVVSINAIQATLNVTQPEEAPLSRAPDSRFLRWVSPVV